MRIRAVEVREHAVPLTRPYTIAGGTTAAVELVTVEIATDGPLVGLGAATPEPSVTGESFDDCRAALAAERTAIFVGAELASWRALVTKIAGDWRDTPAAAAALDGALHDLASKSLGVPLVDLFGRVHPALPTSVTIGILPLDETLAEAHEHVANGFVALKLKIGRDLEGDLERIVRTRESVGSRVALRVDGNCGFRASELARLLEGCERAGVELVEQPCPPEMDLELRDLPLSTRRLLAADESIHSPADALRLAGGEPLDRIRLAAGEPLYGAFVIKLMKCGGVAPALAIAAIAEAAGIGLMWGCMDESVAGIAAALHAAYSAPATRWLDLDGSFDLARDPARGGFRLADGLLHLLPTPGVGAELVP